MDTSRLFSLEGRTALVTGGSRGIGRMIAEGYISQGARVYITARKQEACDATAAEPSRRGPGAPTPPGSTPPLAGGGPPPPPPPSSPGVVTACPCPPTSPRQKGWQTSS